MSETKPAKTIPANSFMSAVIFGSRWLQAPLYLGLIFAQAVYVYHFIVELIHLLQEVQVVTETEIMLVVLSLVDVVMISNLLVMVIIGGYETFVSRLQIGDHPDAPDWLAHVNANTMKIKLAMALIGISSIHLLKSFIDIERLSDRVIMGQIAIHCTFLISALLLAYTAKVTQSVTEDTHH